MMPLLIAWYFALTCCTNGAAGRVVGPFDNKEDCERIRGSYKGVFHGDPTPCWQGRQ